jgi:hypothetical protein
MTFLNGGKMSCKVTQIVFLLNWKFFFANTILKSSKKWTSLHGALHIIKQKVDEKVEVYYVWILKLANYMQHKANDKLLMVFLKMGLIFISLNHYCKNETRHTFAT